MPFYYQPEPGEAERVMAAVASARQATRELSPREAAVYLALGRGGNRGQIARELDVSPKTVDVHLLNIRRKLALSSHQLLIQAGLAAL